MPNTKKDLKNMDNVLAETISLLLNSHNMTEGDLARKLSLPYNTIHRIFTGSVSDPRTSTLNKISAFFGVTLDSLINGNLANLETNSLCYTIPMLSWQDITKVEKGVEINKITNVETFDILNIEGISNSSNLFALKSTRSMSPSFPLGTTFIVDKCAEPIDGDLVLIYFIKNKTSTLKYLIVDPPKTILSGIVNNSEEIVFNENEHKTLGVVMLTLIEPRRY